MLQQNKLDENVKEKFPWILLTDLAEERIGGQVLFATDEFFAPASWLLKPGRGEFYPGKFTENGQYMEGWETRRHNPDHDWCIIRLGLSGIIHGVDIDTNHFTGNYAVEASLEAVCLDNDPPINVLLDNSIKWEEILSKQKLVPGTPDKGHNYFSIQSKKRWTHIRFHIYPDGGVARLKIYGKVIPNWNLYDQDEVINLLGIENGAEIISCSDAYFSKPENLIMPNRGKNMGDGWETKRRRGPGYDWVILKLGHPGIAKRIIIDTNHFKGNFPESFSFEGCYLKEQNIESVQWKEIISKNKLSAHKEHIFLEFTNKGPFTHVRLNIFPDGGVSRLRFYGRREFK
jgi:allantoicase